MIPVEKTDNWFLFSREANKELFSELDVLLRSMDELKDKPIDIDKAEELLRQYL